MAKAKKCVKCGARHEYDDDDAVAKNFGKSETSCDGYQSYCNACKNTLGKRRRQQNVSARLRHHISTRVTAQLGSLTPESLTAELQDYLGYSIHKLVKYLSTELKGREGPKRKLRDALEEGYHIDHIHPLSKFPVVVANSGPAGWEEVHMDHVDWDVFRDCWRMDNLRAIPADENLAKGAKVQ